MPEPEIIPPDRIEEELRLREWGYVTTAGQVTALICPLCGSLVAPGGPAQGITFRESHVRYHGQVAQGIFKFGGRA